MALSKAKVREILSAAGVDTEHMATAVDAIIDGNIASIEALREDVAKYKADAEKLAAVQKELDELKAQPEDGYKARYEKERDAFKAYKAETEAKAALAAKKAAYTEICKDAGLNEKGVAKALKYADWNAVELDEAGKVKDAKDHIKALKEEWAEHVVTTTTHGANTPNPPANNGGALKSREEIYKTDERGRFVMDATQRQAALAQIIAAEQQKG